MTDAQIWAMFYAGLVAFQFHPGTKTRMSLAELAVVADEMLLFYQDRNVELGG